MCIGLLFFHNRCVRTILGVSRLQLWNDHITSQQLSVWFGMPWSIADYVLERRLRCLGHWGRMDEDRSPKQLLFGELVKIDRSMGPRRDGAMRW